MEFEKNEGLIDFHLECFHAGRHYSLGSTLQINCNLWYVIPSSS